MAIQDPYAMPMHELKRAMTAESTPPAEPQWPNVLDEFRKLAPDYDAQRHQEALVDLALWKYLQDGELPTANDLLDAHALNTYHNVYPQAAPEPEITEANAWSVPFDELSNVMHGLPQKPDMTDAEHMDMGQLRADVLGYERPSADAAWTMPKEQLKAAMEDTNGQG